MKRFSGRPGGKGLVCAGLASLLVFAGPGGGVAPAHAEGGSINWSNGLQYTSGDGSVRFKLGGRLYADWAWMGASEDLRQGITGWEDGTELRTARIFVSGVLHDDIEFKLQVDFTSITSGFKDAYVGLTDFPLGTLRIGQQKVSQGMESTTSSRFTTFMERSVSADLDPDRQMAIKLFDGNAGETLTWSATFYKPSLAPGAGEGIGDGRYGFAGRLTGLAGADEANTGLVHLGASARHELGEGPYAVGARPEAHLAPAVVLAELPVDGVSQVQAEIATIQDRLHAHGEFSVVAVNPMDPVLDTEMVTGFFAEIGYFLTGADHRAYDRGEGTFDRVVPAASYGHGGGGAVQVAGRFSRLDASEIAGGGAVSDVTVGVNWYLNPNARMMANYVYSSVDDAGSANIVETRFQVDF